MSPATGELQGAKWGFSEPVDPSSNFHAMRILMLRSLRDSCIEGPHVRGYGKVKQRHESFVMVAPCRSLCRKQSARQLCTMCVLHVEAPPKATSGACHGCPC